MLAAEMILYGLDKVFPLQFHEMTLARMMQPLSAKTPMGVLWDFMAVSTGYTIFTGLVEVAGGLLLLVPAWTTMGALLCAAAMTNVFALNLAYDIPVKRTSSYLLLLSLFLVAPAVPRLFRFFVLNRDVAAQPEPLLSERRRVRQAVLWIPVAICGVVFLAACSDGFAKMHKRTVARQHRSRWYGVWDVISFTASDPTHPLFTSKLMHDMQIRPQAAAWQHLVFESQSSAEIQLSDGLLDHVDLKDDGNSLTLTDSGDPDWICVLKPQASGDGQLVLDGTINGGAVHAVLSREDEKDFLLTKRRFHWVNEW